MKTDTLGEALGDFKGTAEDMAAHAARHGLKNPPIDMHAYLLEKIQKLEKEIKDLKADNYRWQTQNIAMVEKLDDYKAVADQLHKESVELQNLKAKMRLNISNKAELDYFMLKDGDLPILWVNAWNKDLFPSQAFTQMADRIKKVNPNIDLIILTYGVETIQQLDDADLAKLGLYRDLDAPSLVKHEQISRSGPCLDIPDPIRD